MLLEVLIHIRNVFPAASPRRDHYRIENGSIALDFLKAGQYFLIEGSTFNDGVYPYTGDVQLTDEEFDGWITPLAIPPDFLRLVGEIEDWQAQNGTASPYSSESFGGYSYTRATNSSGDSVSWKDVFKARLNDWRKV